MFVAKLHRLEAAVGGGGFGEINRELAVNATGNLLLRAKREDGDLSQEAMLRAIGDFVPGNEQRRMAIADDPYWLQVQAVLARAYVEAAIVIRKRAKASGAVLPEVAVPWAVIAEALCESIPSAEAADDGEDDEYLRERKERNKDQYREWYRTGARVHDQADSMFMDEH